jgi:PTS system mannose-specific IIA component
VAEASGTMGLLVVSHGTFAEELVHAARRIVGEVQALEAVAIGWDDAVGDAGARIEAALRRVDRGHGALLLTDMFGGTPTNLALSLFQEGKVEIVTGVNLPMIIKALNLAPGTTLQDAASLVARQGREAIHVASQLLGRQGTGATEPER